MELTRTDLYLSMRFLAEALDSLQYVMDLRTKSLGTDAAAIRFNPNWLLWQYADRPMRIKRAYLHMLMHCIFRHMFFAKEYGDPELWDLCCDIAAESLVDSTGILSDADVVSDFREEWYARLTEEVKVLTAQKLYHYFSTVRQDPYDLELLRREFTIDDHQFWDRTPDRDDWGNIARRMQEQIEMGGREASEAGGSISRQLTAVLAKRRDYRDFLRRFFVLREETGIDPDSFDYAYYYYGLTMYGDMPLIEENEFREADRIDTLVIAIDTSASCQPALVQKFLDETAALLAGRENFFRKVHIRIIECDNRVQKDVVITDLDQLRAYRDGFEVKGGFGTDFRPVFSYVEDLRRTGLKHLKGLVYFTDGFGTFPEHPTTYDTAFLFWTEEAYDDTKVPAWALKLLLRAEPG